MYFIEVAKFPDGDIRNSIINPIRIFDWSLEVNKKHGIETIAVFKIYPKQKPLMAHYDSDLKAVIVE